MFCACPGTVALGGCGWVTPVAILKGVSPSL